MGVWHQVSSQPGGGLPVDGRGRDHRQGKVLVNQTQRRVPGRVSSTGEGRQSSSRLCSGSFRHRLPPQSRWRARSRGQ
ncbi:hypothetical protein VFPBJ_03192 [Purpureocillium lilacinum]|uniref:Uncharacterized protein n=1 Tax=Purpureocillium lilacinum TaxID=33203 RepID=A0A179H2P0_PURLI|nr:hypothetical protein VFPBJ_03192 [Purpureocillium lilacinum]